MKRLWFLLAVATPLMILPALAQDEAAPDGDTTPANGVVTAPRQVQKAAVLIVTSKNLAALRTLADTANIRAVSLGVTRAVLTQDQVASSALMDWVRDGGTVFVHTDAAQLFGYRTVDPRGGTPRVAGQFWGRARAAVPFGANQLLQGAVSGKGRTANNSRSIVSAVRTVYYQLENGDQLAESHPSAIPLLRVTDMTVGAQDDLYAAAVAAYGRGWAIFTPGAVDEQRADGGLFLYNLMKWAGVVSADSSYEAPGGAGGEGDGAGGATPGTGEPGSSPVNLPASAIERAVASAQTNDFNPTTIASDFLRAARAGGDEPAVAGADAADANATNAEAANVEAADNGNEQSAGLPLSQSEFAGLVRLLRGAAAGEQDAGRARAALFLLRARLAWQAGNIGVFNQWLRQASGVTNDAAEIALFSGLQSAEASENYTLPAAQRAQLLANAAASWQASLTRAPLVTTATGEAPAPQGTAPGGNENVTDEAINADGGQDDARQDGAIPDGDMQGAGGQDGEAVPGEVNPGEAVPEEGPPTDAAPIGAAGRTTADEGTVAGISRSLIQEWIRSAGYMAQLYASEPPLVTTVGEEGSSLVIRYFEDDPSLRLAIPVAQQLVDSAKALGIQADDEEVLFFPTPEYYAAYRRAAGHTGQNAPIPNGFVGDAVEGRMLLLSQPTQLIILPPAGPGLPSRPLPFTGALSAVMARLHGQVLINQVVGSAPGKAADVPAWMQLGLESYTSKGVVAALGQAPVDNGALDFGAATGTLLSAEDYRTIAGGGAPNEIADAQAARLVEFFYTRFGAGRVAEFLQRLGAGENADDALDATTGLTEEQFFAAWYKAETGRR